jgi:hypothetical protein
MLRVFSKFFAIAFSCGVASGVLGACSIHPLPKDVTGYETPTIVRKIRCEAQGAIRKAALEILHKNGRHQEFADENSLVFDPKSLTRWERDSLADLARIGIVYDFSLEGVETGSLTFNADIIKPLTNGTETYSPSLSDTLKRDNTRTFTVSDSFTTLLNLGKKNPRHCEFLASGPNYQYPIAGRIGIDEMILTFVRLAISGDLVAQEDPTKITTDDILSPAGPPTMVDNLIFTTTVSAGLTPKIVLSPVGAALQLEDATLVGSISRVDTHMVTIGLALGKSPSMSPGAVASLLSPNTRALFFTQSIKDPNSGEALAGQAIVQRFFQRDLLRRGSIAIVP